MLQDRKVGKHFIMHRKWFFLESLRWVFSCSAGNEEGEHGFDKNRSVTKKGRVDCDKIMQMNGSRDE